MPLLKLAVDYLPSIFISGVNLVLPPVFKLIAPLEGYTRSRQIILILLRFHLEGWAGGDGAAGVLRDVGASREDMGIPAIWGPVRSGFNPGSLSLSLGFFICELGRFVSKFCAGRAWHSVLADTLYFFC